MFDHRSAAVATGVVQVRSRNFDIQTLGPWCFLAAATIAAAAASGRSAVLNALVLILVVGDLLVFYAASEYAALVATANTRQASWDQYSASLFLQHYVNSNVPTVRLSAFGIARDLGLLG